MGLRKTWVKEKQDFNRAFGETKQCGADDAVMGRVGQEADSKVAGFGPEVWPSHVHLTWTPIPTSK